MNKAISTTPLIVQTDLYGRYYMALANDINTYHKQAFFRKIINHLLVAFFFRDFEELAGIHEDLEDWEGMTMSEVFDRLDEVEEYIVNNLDENDLETIIKFCGKELPKN